MNFLEQDNTLIKEGIKVYLYLGKVLSNVLWSGHNFLLSDPVFEVIDFSLQLVQLEGLVQFASALFCQILESLVQFLDLSLADFYCFTIKYIKSGDLT